MADEEVIFKGIFTHRSPIPQNIQVLVPLGPVNVMYKAKQTLRLRLNKVLNLGDYPGSSQWPLNAIMCPYKRGRRKFVMEEGNVANEGRHNADGVIGHMPKNAALEAGKGKEMGSSLQTPEGAWPTP